MGRHTQPGTGAPTPDTGFWVRFGVAAVVVVVALAWWVSSGGGDDPVTTTSPDRSASPATSSGTGSATGSASASPAPTTSSPPASSASPSPSPSKQPPLLAFTVKRKSYITVRVPGGRTITSRLFPAGAKRTFDAKVLQVVNGRPNAVLFVVNGKPRKPGPADQPETFTVRRP